MTIKTHTAILADRYEIQGRLYVRVRVGNGPTTEVQVPEELRAEAAAIYGGGRVRYQFRGGRPFFVSPYPMDIALTVSARRPDLAAGDAIAAVLTADPTLTADAVIEILDQAAADYAAEQA